MSLCRGSTFNPHLVLIGDYKRAPLRDQAIERYALSQVG
jgi:hypothetical protein